METTSDRDSIASTATIQLPLYTIAAYKDGTPPGEDVPLTRKVRVGVEMDKLKCGARIEVYCWYSCPELDINPDSAEKELCFKGYIRQVIGSFPTTIRCEDMSFPLRFGDVNKTWPKPTSIVDIVNDILPISEAAFSKYRTDPVRGLDDNWQRITITGDEIATADQPFSPWKDISPYDALQKFLSENSIYGNVDYSGELHIGVGQSETTNKTVKLDTRLNVIECDLVTTDSMFVNYSVTINAFNTDGKPITTTYGADDGEPLPTKWASIRTQAGIEQLAKTRYNAELGNTNSGTITTLLLPRVELFDFITFNHSLFPELSGDYMCIGLECTYGDGGYRQQIKVTDKKFYF